jgi:hypothetical protein
MRTGKALRGDPRTDYAFAAGRVSRPRSKRLGLALAAILALALTGGAETAAGAGNYSCPGLESLEFLTTGEGNTACGKTAMHDNTSGRYNVASGFAALFSNTDGESNVAVGQDALAFNTEGSSNVALGQDALLTNTEGRLNVASGPFAMWSNTTGSDNVASGPYALYYNNASYNVASGPYALYYNSTGSYNVASGLEALYANTKGAGNVASGPFALSGNTTGSNNVASGPYALKGNIAGNENVALGYKAGTLLTGSNNIDLANEGVAVESGTTRVGTEGTQTKAFVAGVAKTAVKGCSVQVTGEGQLGCNKNPEGSSVATYASPKAVENGKCLNFTGRGAPGTGACPAATTGFSVSKLLSLAMPANGATVSNLYAATSATVSGSDTAVVEVIDNTTSTVLLTCTVNSTNKNTCTNNSATGAAAAGNKLEVRITTTGTSGAGKGWEVTFRY